jgi:hypothetical protein
MSTKKKVVNNNERPNWKNREINKDQDIWSFKTGHLHNCVNDLFIKIIFLFNQMIIKIVIHMKSIE